MTRSSEEIERDVEATRDDLDRTLDALKDKLNPGQIVDELANGLKGSGGREILERLSGQARENPLALALVGVGLVWLMSGKGGRSSTAATGAAGAGEGRFDGVGSADVAQHASDLAEKAADAAGAVKEHVSEAAHQAMHALGGGAGQAGRSVQHGLAAVVENDPLIVGAVGLAVGVAVGASMPATPVENRTFGALRDRAVEAGMAAGRQVVDQAKDTAGAALQGGVEAGREALEAGRAH